MTLVIPFICFFIFIIFIKDAVLINNDSISEIKNAEDDTYYKNNNYLNDSSDHIIWFLQVTKKIINQKTFENL
jgi:hypothetical protein